MLLIVGKKLIKKFSVDKQKFTFNFNYFFEKKVTDGEDHTILWTDMDRAWLLFMDSRGRVYGLKRGLWTACAVRHRGNFDLLSRYFLWIDERRRAVTVRLALRNILVDIAATRNSDWMYQNTGKSNSKY